MTMKSLIKAMSEKNAGLRSRRFSLAVYSFAALTWWIIGYFIFPHWDLAFRGTSIGVRAWKMSYFLLAAAIMQLFSPEPLLGPRSFRARKIVIAVFAVIAVLTFTKVF